MRSKKILLLQLRPEDAVADDEYAAIIRAGVSTDRIIRIRMESQGLPKVNLTDFAAVIVGGGPSNVSDPVHKQSAHQQRYEPLLYDLISEIVARDFPYLGICYGMGALTVQQGGVVSKKHAEPVGAVDIVLHNEHRTDHLICDLPDSFKAYVGHKEAVERVPSHATILAASQQCPVQLYRIGNHIYASQFHPELTADSLALRINAYKDMGYFHPSEAEDLITEAYNHEVTESNKILKRFVSRYII